MPTPSSAMELGASVRMFMNELQPLEEEVSARAVADAYPSLAVYRWRRNAIDAPALYHMIGGDAASMPDQSRIQDVLTLSTRIAVAIGDDGYESDYLLEYYIDLYRDVMDPPLWQPGTALNGAGRFVNRTNMRTLLDEFGGVPYLAVEFIHTVQLNRRP